MSTIEKIISSLKEKKTKSKYFKWFWYLLAGAVGFILIAGLVLQTMNKSRKAAKALHKLDVMVEKQNIEAVNAKVAESQAKQEKHMAKAKKYSDKAKALDIKRAKLEKEAERNRTIIDNIQSWDDVDKVIKY